MTRPLCTNCEHCSLGVNPHQYSECDLTKPITGTSLVTGEAMREVATGLRVYCENQRDAGWLYARLTNRCGAEGRFFESRVSA